MQNKHVQYTHNLSPLNEMHIGMMCFSTGTNGPLELPCTQLDHMKDEMHIHQRNHWNDMLFYWYQSYHWYQRTIGIALYATKSHGK